MIRLGKLAAQGWQICIAHTPANYMVHGSYDKDGVSRRVTDYGNTLHDAITNWLLWFPVADNE